MDAETGLYNYDARLYDPVIGRFTSADTIVPRPYNPQSLNRYSYCRNNPLIYVDPTGHEDEGWHDGGWGWDSDSQMEDNGTTDIGGSGGGWGYGNSGGKNKNSAAAAGVAVTAGSVGQQVVKKGAAVATGAATAIGVGMMTTGMVLGMPSNTIVTEKEELEMLSKAQESLNMDETDDDGVGGEEGGEDEAEEKKTGAGKSDPHGDGGRAIKKAQKRVKELERQMEGTSKKQKKRIKKKIQKIIQDAQKKRKGETHWN